MNILIEASGSLTSGYLIKAIQTCGHKVVGSDISEFNHAKILCDDFIVMPKCNDPHLWEKTLALLKKHEIDVVLPSFDETLLQWSLIADKLKLENIHVIISPLQTINIFQDKWNTYEFFKKVGIPTPQTSLQAHYQLIKPRFGRGSSGIFENDFKTDFSMQGMISQEKLAGEEYTVDVLFSKDHIPLYIVPRKRMDIKEGKSTKGIVVEDKHINDFIVKISQNAKFVGPINFQFFKTKEDEYFFIEINPRIAGGMALGFAATENWINLIIENIVYDKEILLDNLKEIKYGLKMVRYYEECFIQ